MTHLLIVGGTRSERLHAAHAEEVSGRAGAIVVLKSTRLPFAPPAATRLPVARPRLIRIDDLECAFPNVQTGGIRLVLTQSQYALQKWLTTLDSSDRIVATADRDVLARAAPEVLEGRGPWRLFRVVECRRVSSETDAEGGPSPEALHPDTLDAEATESFIPDVIETLCRAYRSSSPDERLRLCHDAVVAAPDSAVAALALASACRETADMGGARRALDAALRLAPSWEAAHFEDGKFWLATEDMDRARGAFERACNAMPAFSTAFSNLGAILGELGLGEEALAAFQAALRADPESFMILNNIGVATRELGRLGDSETALRQAIAIAPQFVFGHYNLGHTLFLDGRYQEALTAYEEGQRLDVQKNRRQGCRLAITRFANGDVAGAERDLWQFVDQAPQGEREDLLLEAYEIAHAVVRSQPQLGAQTAFLARIAAELPK